MTETAHLTATRAGYDAMAEQVARLARLELHPDGGDPVARVTIPGGALLVFAGGGFDPEAAERRRAQRRGELEGEITRSQRKLANPGFIEKAPADVVAGEREKLERLRSELESL